MHPRTSCLRAAFTLIELLVVVSIMAILMVGAMPAINGMAMTQGVKRATNGISGLLELARSEAVTRQTYVWVGFTNDTANSELVVGAVYSRDGSGTNLDTQNLAPLSKAIRLNNVVMAPWSALKSETKALLAQVPSSVAANTAGISFKVGATSFSSRSTMTFTPRGEATLAGSVGPDEGFNPYIDVSFRQARGATVLPKAEEAAVVVDGATGMTRILRIQ